MMMTKRKQALIVPYFAFVETSLDTRRVVLRFVLTSGARSMTSNFVNTFDDRKLG